MTAGLMDQRVSLLRRQAAAAASGSGTIIEDWTSVADVWAWVRPSSGGESVASDTLVSTISYQVRVRYRDGVDTTWRLRWRGRVLNVVSVVPSGLRMREWLDLTVTDDPGPNPVLG